MTASALLAQEEGKFEKGILMIQRLWRGRTQRLKYRAVLQAARTIQTFWLTHIRPVQLARYVLRWLFRVQGLWGQYKAVLQAACTV